VKHEATNEKHGDCGHSISGRKQSTKHDTLDEVKVGKFGTLVDTVEGQAEDEAGHDSADNSIGSNTAEIAHEVTLLQGETSVENHRREKNLIENLTESVGSEKFQKASGFRELYTQEHVNS